MAQSVIFICYSHKDEREKDRLLVHLGVLQRQGLINLWSDDLIRVGTNWEKEISETIVQAKVAILLITANLLTSDLILGKEVPALLKRHESEGLTVFPVIIKPCCWQEVGWLTKMNVRPKNDRAIWGTGTRRVDADLAAIAKEVASVVKADSYGTPIASSAYGKSERSRIAASNQRLQIFFQGDFSLLSNDRKSAAIAAFAAEIGIAPQSIETYSIYEG